MHEMALKGLYKFKLSDTLLIQTAASERFLQQAQNQFSNEVE